jgi:eukaryotic-like serine/threonine-protein kinase
MNDISLAPYEQIGKFQVKRLIRSTGSSDLYECFDPDLGVRVALKIFNPKERLLKALPYSVENWQIRFMREARILAQVDHPHVISVRELSYIDGKPYYVMPYVETNLIYEMGRDDAVEEYAAELADTPDPQKLSLVRATDILFQLASALSAFHGRGLVHRDIKPGNVLLTKKGVGLVKLCDPGLMKFPNSQESLEGYWIGTLDYLAPEQRRSSIDVDARADIFSLGTLGYRMFTGYLPSGVFSGPKEEVMEMPDQLNDLIMRSMSRKVKNRPQNALAFLTEIAPIRAQIKRT